MKALITALLIAAPAAASAQVVTDRDAFVALVEGRSLTQRLLGVDLRVSSDGQITGGAMGGAVTGSWVWQDRFFCREMAWGSRLFDLNCQAVVLDGDLLRFTADKGAGDSAALRIR